MYNVLNVMNMDITIHYYNNPLLEWIAHTGYHLQVHLHITTDHNLDINAPIDPPHATITKTGTNAVDTDHNHTIEDTTAKVTITPTEAF